MSDRGHSVTEPATGSLVLARSTGVTLRRLQYWREREIIRCEFVGHSCRYSPIEALVAVVACDFRRKGVQLWALRSLGRALRAASYKVATAGLAVWTGERFRLMSDQEMIAFAKRHAGPLTVVSVADHAQRLEILLRNGRIHGGG